MTRGSSALRMPAEWEPHAATWLAWPHNRETWPDALEQAQAEFVALVDALAASEPVRLLVPDAVSERSVRERLAGVPASLHVVPTDDAWLRDTGPTFVLDARGERIAIDWTFDAWGGKYPPWDRDDAVARAVAEIAGAARVRPGLVCEGGALEVDGAGTLLATRSTLLDPKRNPDIDAARIEALLAQLLGARELVWLDAMLAGDDTDGHVDQIARFVAPGRVVCVRASDPRDPNRSVLERSRAQLAERFEVLDLPLPEPIEHAGQRLPASYANFYVANRRVLVPAFDVPTDARALEILAPLFPGRDLVPVRCRTLVRGLGSVHCLTQQEPRAAAPGVAPTT